MKTQGDTICAQATPPGKGGVGIIRISGPKAATIAETILGHCPKTRYAEFLPFNDEHGQMLDQGIALFFKGPNSFTGEDVLELQGHGGQVIMDMLLRRVVAAGARLAEPGEFSRRAFLNDKIDLAQAEAIADLINASTEEAAKSAMRSLRGDFSAKVHALVEQLIYLRMYVESAIDFPEEEIDFLSDGEVERMSSEFLAELQQVLHAAEQGCLLNEGMTLVILGQPNAGKSSLLNTLSARETAIVTDIAGTTRDVLREQIQIDGMPVNIVDTAGLRESTDVVELEGIRRAWREVEQADRILLLLDDTQGWTAAEQAIIDKLPRGTPVTVVRNKIDLSGGNVVGQSPTHGPSIGISLKTGAGMDELKSHLKQLMGYQGGGEGVFMARRRHVDALQRALALTQTGMAQLQQHAAGELLAEDLRQVQQVLNEITGEFDHEDLLGRIFSSFCIGK
ncbi:MAG: tRNA uridine-5-carboxymethylaminomethyl(34) synthesis GTPase MnmE [Gammaproteobacteria bacterium]|nr:tRNA uridine-5-carboxymethylaminomethyl(34) synthesis GTPase MnmE [Gammaproteobacteria bacterium]